MYKHIKYIGCIVISLTITSAHALTCNGGTEVTATDNMKYCQSPAKMNWWSAEAWCQSNGGHLVSFETVCGPNGVVDAPYGCQGKFVGVTGDFWLIKPKPSPNVCNFIFNESVAQVGCANRDSSRYALCE